MTPTIRELGAAYPQREARRVLLDKDTSAGLLIPKESTHTLCVSLHSSHYSLSIPLTPQLFVTMPRLPPASKLTMMDRKSRE